MANMDRNIRRLLAHTIVQRTRDYTDDALNDLFRAMDDVEQARGLIPLLTEADEAAQAVAEEKLARREHLPGLELRGPDRGLSPGAEQIVSGDKMKCPRVDRSPRALICCVR